MGAKLIRVRTTQSLEVNILYSISVFDAPNCAGRFTSDHWNKSFGILCGLIPNPRGRSWRSGFRIFGSSDGELVIETGHYYEANRRFQVHNKERHFFVRHDDRDEARISDQIVIPMPPGLYLVKRTFPYYGGNEPHEAAPVRILIREIAFHVRAR